MRTPFEFERERAEAGVLLPKGNKPERQNTELPLNASEQDNLLTSTKMDRIFILSIFLFLKAEQRS